MLLKKLTIYIFVIGLLSSNVTWAGNGMVDNMIDNLTHTHQTLQDDQHNNLMHHMVDKHHDDHDCHMSAHLIGLNTNVINIVHYSITQDYAALNIQFSTHLVSPPNRPPRA